MLDPLEKVFMGRALRRARCAQLGRIAWSHAIRNEIKFPFLAKRYRAMAIRYEEKAYPERSIARMFRENV